MPQKLAKSFTVLSEFVLPTIVALEKPEKDVVFGKDRVSSDSVQECFEPSPSSVDKVGVKSVR